MNAYKRFPFTGRWWWTVFVALIVLVAACTSSSTATEPAAELPPAESATARPGTPATGVPESQLSTPTVTPASPTAEPGTPTPDAAALQYPPPLPDDPTELMRATLPGNVADIAKKMVASGDKSFIPVLMEFMRFPPFLEMRFPTEGDARFCVVCSINKLVEGPDNELVTAKRWDWGWWMEWLGDHPEVQAPDGFDGWKGELYSVIDRSFRGFFYDGVKTRIRLEEVAWGGVKKDGIPDLNKPPAIPAGQATYLEDSDRVFGVSINGEHRAYPLRILNPHEMANDVVGGVPFALAY